MIRSIMQICAAVVFGFAAWIAQAAAQQSDPPAFTPDNAILDTSIAFVIGAQEARQDLRGAFGWDTFQEGLVEGVYFRFDPDGYARFAPTPRLDTDVFEVICRPGTTTCVARKGPLTVFLTGQNAVQLRLDGYRDTDRIYVAEELSEIELPAQVMMPLDARLEALLSVGGELITRRGEVEAQRVSLAGFGPVSTYLRWVVSGQNAASLPHNWPVPTESLAATQLLTRAPVGPSIIRNQTAPVYERPVVGAEPAAPAPVPVVEQTPLSALEQLLQNSAHTAVNGAPSLQLFRDPAPTPTPQHQTEIANLARQIAELRAQVTAMQQASLASVPSSSPHTVQNPLAWPAPSTPPSATDFDALVHELGLSSQNSVAPANDNELMDKPASPSRQREDVVTKILEELRAELPSLEVAPSQKSAPEVKNPPPSPEFQSLNSYIGQ